MRGGDIADRFIFGEEAGHSLFRAFPVFPKEVNNDATNPPIVSTHNI